MIEASRQGLRKIIDASASLQYSRSLKMFANGVLLQITSLLHATRGGILCTQRCMTGTMPFNVVAASGRFLDVSEADADFHLDSDVASRIRTAFEMQETCIQEGCAMLYLRTPNAQEVVVYVEADIPLDEVERSLLEVFGTNISIGFDNLEMYDRLVETNATLEQRVMERTHQLQERETRLQAILEASPIGVALVRRADGRPLFANSRLAEMLGYSPMSVTTSFVESVIANPVECERFLTTLNRMRQVVDFEALIEGRDRVSWSLVSARLLGIEGEEILLAWFYDIWQRKALEEELRHLAATDPMTGLANRRRFFEIGEREVQSARRYASPLALLMIDIDHFKRVNDTFGHPAGDEVIKALAGACVDELRAPDAIGRLGGEEFAALLPKTSLAEAENAAERLRQAIANLALPLSCGTITFTISIGVAELKPADPSIQVLLQRADAALYESKARGRNRVTCRTVNGSEKPCIDRGELTHTRIQS